LFEEFIQILESFASEAHEKKSITICIIA